MEIIREKIALADLKKMSLKMFESIVKAVVDVEKEIMVVDAGMHADQEELLLNNDSKQENLWGINLHPEDYGTDAFVEFYSMINIRPSCGNSSRSVNNPQLQNKIKTIVHRLVVTP